MKATQTPWGQVNAALTKLVLGLGESDVIDKLNNDQDFAMSAAVFVNVAAKHISSRHSLTCRYNRGFCLRKWERDKGYTPMAVAERLKLKRQETHDPCAEFAILDYWIWRFLGGPFPRDVNIIGDILGVDIEKLKEL